MSENVRIVRVFIGSPSGLEDERRAAHEIINEVNNAHAEHWGCQFKLVGWEDTIPGFHRPQSLINLDLDKCQYFIGVLWNRWGTKPDLDDSGFTSGFEEEYHRAQYLFDSGSMKDIALYFKTVNVPDGLELGAEMKKVKSFRERCIDEKRIFFKDFNETADFRDLIRSKIVEIGWTEFQLQASLDTDNSHAEQSPQENSGGEGSSDNKFFDQNAIDFILEMSSRTRESEQTSAYDVARFRLIAASLHRSGNDQLYLGNHDANLIFRHRTDISFSLQELRALVDCGIVGFDRQNVPLWRWLIAIGTKNQPFERINFLAVWGNTEEQKNAIKLLQILGEPVPDFTPYFPREQVLARWLGLETNNQIFDAAAQFLSFNGTLDDVDIIDDISANLELPADRKANLDAVVASIKTRSSRVEALEFICANRVEKVSETFVETIFAAPSTLPTAVLALCLAAKPDSVRLRAVKLMIERDELAEDAAHSLLSDSNHQIRLLAVERLETSDNPLPPETVKAALTIKKSSRGLAFFSSIDTDSTYYDRYLDNRLHQLDFERLSKRVAEAGVFNKKELFALYRKFGKRLSDEIRANLSDRFATMFEDSVKKAEAIPGIGEDYRTQAYRLLDFYQKQLCSGALAELCRLQVKTDIKLVRATLDATEIEVSPELLSYLAKYGDWSDVVRIERLTTPLSGMGGLFIIRHYYTFADEKAAAILKIGKNRIADLLNMELSAPIRKSIVKLLPKGVFLNLSNDAIISELDRNDDDYRSFFSLRCVESLPKERIERILDLYVERDTQRYYNSIHWLDLGASFPKKQVTAIVSREMIRRSQ